MGETRGCINLRDKTRKKRVVTRDEGGRGAITTAAGLWVDEEREALWWQRPRKLGGGVCKCEECTRTILQGRKRGRLVASWMVGCEGTWSLVLVVLS